VTLDERTLGCLLVDGSLLESFPAPTRDFWKARVYAQPLAGTIATVVERLGGSAAKDMLPIVMRTLDDAEARAAAAGLASEVERITEGQADRVRAHWDECVRRLELERTRDAQDTLARDETDNAIDSRVRRIEMIRETHRRHGGNPSAVPRPAV
jgi:hypothetical protein